MGMFDSVYATCVKCGGTVEWQSKADDCVLAVYSPESMPQKIAADLNGKIAECRNCPTTYMLGNKVDTVEESFVSLPVTLYSS